MAMRHSWEGFLQLSLISIPVKGYNAIIAGQGEVQFHQYHKDCGARIRYKKVCEIHGEVTKDEIVSGYEYQKDRHVEIQPGEIAKVRAKKNHTIAIETFVAPDQIDPIHISGKTFYLAPDGPAAARPYNLLLKIMQEKKRHAVAEIVLSGHEETVLIRPMENLLLMSVLYLDNQIKNPAELDFGESKVSTQEMKLAGSLVDASTSKRIDFSKYKDQYAERIRDILAEKLAGKDVEGPKAKAKPVINLMDALRKSLKQPDRKPKLKIHKQRAG